MKREGMKERGYEREMERGERGKRARKKDRERMRERRERGEMGEIKREAYQHRPQVCLNVHSAITTTSH